MAHAATNTGRLIPTTTTRARLAIRNPAQDGTHHGDDATPPPGNVVGAPLRAEFGSQANRGSRLSPLQSGLKC
jgi:hypothetical protein